MTTNILFFFCVQIFLFKTISAYCTNPAWANGLPNSEGLGWAFPGEFAYETPLTSPTPCAAAAPFLGAYNLAALPSSYGGGFVIRSASPVPPYGVSIISENGIEGLLAIGGELPFLGTIGLEGALPSTGAGVISYSCGNGNMGMISEDLSPAAAGLGWSGNRFNYGPVMANGFGYGAGWAGPTVGYGCDCGVIY